ncbi:MAG: homogentisate 1,2-dioxygenase [Proteobacteria bacterium]|nr:homogentisate 1,2-dioxygenase [Pseudomonadota bacterium]
MDALKYLSGFNNEHFSEAIVGAVPANQNSPQKPPLGLYAEQLSGSAFTMPRKENYRSWLYRILPSVCHGHFKVYQQSRWKSAIESKDSITPMQLRWNPQSEPEEAIDFIDSVITFALNGSPETRSGSAVHLYFANQSMTEKYFYNSDGELLIVPQSGRLLVFTEFGRLLVSPTEICVVPRGVKFRVELPDGKASGYICEIFGSPLELPNLGPIGSNGLAASRDFQYPTAFFEDDNSGTSKSAGAPKTRQLVTKFCGGFWVADIDHSPLDVVGWFGNYAPYKYDLKKFNTINTVSFDHPDPSIFTVLTSTSAVAGQANVDFVIFPPRWMVAENTFRPPYFHRNVMSEFMGLIHGVYDAKPSGGFDPGGASLHNCMQAHGPEAEAFKAASNAELKPQYLDKTLAFMFESCWVYQPTAHAMTTSTLQKDYHLCWKGLPRQFSKKP